jgi:hypothetical protein
MLSSSGSSTVHVLDWHRKTALLQDIPSPA